MRRVLLIACAAIFIDVAFFAAVTPLIPDYRDDLGISESAAGLLAGSYAFGTLVFAIPGGFISAKIGPRKTMVIGLVGMGLSSLSFGLADSIGWLDVSRFVQGASGSMLWAGAISWVVITARGDQRGALLGTVISAAVVGELLGAPLGAVAFHVGTEYVFGAVAVAAAFLIGIALFTPEIGEIERQEPRESIRILRNSNVPSMAVLVAAPALVFGAITILAPLRFDDLGASPTVIAIAFASGSLSEAIIGPLVGRYSDRSGHRLFPFLIGLCISIVAVLAIGLFETLAFIFGALVIAAVGAGLSFTPATTLLTESADANGMNQGFAAGISNVAWGGGQMIGSVGGGFLADASGFLVPSVAVALILAFVLYKSWSFELPPLPEQSPPTDSEVELAA